jgi:hypothetical protein
MFLGAFSRMNALGFAALMAVIAVALGGCFGLLPIAAATGSFYTASATGKFPIDHFVSMATGQDCAAVHVEARQPYCVLPDGQVAGLAVEKRCYNTIGQVQCYLGPDPYGTRPDPVQ